MRNLKKFLALVLAMMMAFSLMVTANASQDKNAQDIYPDASSVDPAFVEAVDVLYGMGVMTGDSGYVRGDRPIMRSEMATILYRLMTGDTTQLKNQLYADIAAERFIDVQSTDWFAPYIGWCYDAGLMVGSNGYVRPWANVTGYEAEVMVLRAMGYGKNHEYTGTGWSVSASSDATVVGLLADIRNTHYANTLSQNSRRDVVASIVFQAAQLPTVTWSPSLGYNKYVGVAIGTGGNILNPSLGEINFGLTCHYGIVVGNQATGEPGVYSTKIGFSVDPTVTKGLDVGDKISDATASDVIKGYLTDAAITDAGSYYYASNIDVDNADTDNDDTTGRDAKNVTLAFDWKTDLRLFNHKVKVWYNKNGASSASVSLPDGGSVSFGSNCKTYALYDQAKTVVVTSDQDASSVNLTLLEGLADGDADNDNNWSDTELYSRGNAYFNYAFAPMGTANYGANASVGSAKSPVLENKESTSHGLYLLISNGGSWIDVVISLDMTFTQVVQRNATTYPTSVGVTNSNGTNQYFGDSDDDGRLTDDIIEATDASYVSLIEAAILDTEDNAKELGAKVAAIEITGTSGTSTPVTASTVGKAPAAFGTYYISDSSYANGSTFYYNLTKHSRFKTVRVVKVDTKNNDVYTTDPEMPVIHQSVFAEAVDGTFKANDEIEGYTNTSPITFRMIAGKDYTLTLDESDNYIYWETPANTGNFVYGTYIDFTTKLASGLFDYPLVHVDTNGQQQTKNATSIDTRTMGAVEYDATDLNKRDSQSDAGNNSGYKTGKYIGFEMDDNGALTTVTTAISSTNTGFVQDDGTKFGAGTGVQILPTNVAVGAKEVVAGSNLFLTENTQFYIVDGAGQPTQKTKAIKGISKLMEGMDSVVLHGETGYLTSTNIGDYLDVTLCNNPYEMFYYETAPFDYAQNYNDSALEIKTLFLPEVCVEWNATTDRSLVFVGDSTATMINANNSNWATQFTVWRNGEPSNVWIEGDYTSGVANDANQVVTNGDNVFYKLEATSKKATDGETIYKIKAVNNPTTTVLGQYWDGTKVDVSLAAWTSQPVLYRATTFNQQAAYLEDATGANSVLYNVGKAGIKNLDTDYYPGIKDNNLTSLNNAGSLSYNNGVPVSCILDQDDPLYLTVSFIYVDFGSEGLVPDLH